MVLEKIIFLGGLIEKCCECKRVVFPWQRSMSSSIHRVCHEKALKEECEKDPEFKRLLLEELIEIKSRGIDPKINIF